MAAHQFWRAIGIQPYAGSGIRISTFHLLAGTSRVDGGAALSAGVGPTSGALSSLQDSTPTSDVYWANSSLLSLVWDFGSGSGGDVTDIRIGSSDVVSVFPLVVRLQYSDDGINWSDFSTFSGISWPGPRAKTVSDPVSTLWSATDRASTTALDGSRKTLTVSQGKSGRGETGVSSGKQQFEVLHGGSPIALLGVGTAAANINLYPGAGSTSWAYYGNSGGKYTNNVETAYGSTFAAGDIIGVVVDFTAGSLTFYKNGVSQGVAFTGLSGTLFPMFGSGTGLDIEMSATFQAPLHYPVSGASVWGSNSTYRIRTNRVGGIASPVGSAGISSSGSVNSFGATSVIHTLPGRADYLTGVLGRGVGRVAGTVKIDGTPSTPAYRRVRLYRDRDGLLIREAWSDPITGAYKFEYVDELQTYTVISYDHTELYRAVVADRVTPEIMA